MTNYDTYSATGAAVGGLVGAMVVFIVIVVIICIAFGILQIIGTWKTLEKANKPGWGALIPFYREYLLCKISGVNTWWILIVFCAGFLSFIPVIGSLLSFVASIYYAILLNVSLSRSFGKENGFAVGLILLPPIFYFILGIKDSKYLGAKSMNDVVFNKINQNSSNNTNTNDNNQTNATNSNVKYCSSCGAQITTDTRYCPSCGREIQKEY